MGLGTTMIKSKFLENTITQLLETYKVTEILDAIMDTAGDERIHEIRMWFNEYFGKNSDDGNVVDADINILFHEIDHLKMKVATIERCGVIRTEPVKLSDEEVELLKRGLRDVQEQKDDKKMRG